MEQDLTVDPKSGFTKSDPRYKDAHQNDNYTRHSDPRETARDFSRPETIPVEEYERVTGQKHPQTIAREEAAAKEEKAKQQADAELERPPQQ
jgi:hypothetical protein